MKKWQKILVIAGCAINGGIGGALLVSVGDPTLLGKVIVLVSVIVATLTGISIAKGEE